jgi:hypothetical protein
MYVSICIASPHHRRQAAQAHTPPLPCTHISRPPPFDSTPQSTPPGCTQASPASKAAATSSTPLAVSFIVKQFIDSGEHVDIFSDELNVSRTPAVHRRHPFLDISDIMAGHFEGEILYMF